MTLNLLDKIGNWNPQLFREIKGRLKMGNIAIASALSLSGQLLLFMCFKAEIPVAPPPGGYISQITHKFCTSKVIVNAYAYKTICVRDALGNFAINWQYWWLELFVDLSIFSAIVLLVAGTYMLVSDLDKEERRGTLNFIRLSPQSAKTIFLGKILSVPILLYLAAILALPLHLYSGLAAQIPLNEILCFYIAIVASCGLFYSAAMLFGLTTSWLGGFQPWLASATVLFLITVAFNMHSQSDVTDLITFLSPAAVLKLSVIRVINPIVKNSYYELGWLAGSFDKVQWFGLPVGTKLALATTLNFSICATGTYWLWQGWQRRFPNPSATVLSKRQSYLLVVCCQAIFLGFALRSNSTYYGNIGSLLFFNLLMFLALIAALTSDRQSLYDWARYRKQIVPSERKLWRRDPLLDLIWSEKSPAIVAIAINCISLVIILTPLMLLQTSIAIAFVSVILSLNLILIYATIAQLFLLAKNRNQEIWAAGTVACAILLPPLILSMLSLTQEKAPFLWVISTFGSFWFSYSIPVSENTIWLSILSQWTVLVLLNLKLRSHLKIAGESASKALLNS
ncbi:MAG: hypothetical protein HC942_14100 [Microcoleus sp. SU_5_6]|nr:hypothetical protein [Microcoleus sp. SU_5_6]